MPERHDGLGPAAPDARPAPRVEFELIERIRRRIAPRADVELGIGDDAALLHCAPGQVLAVATDTLNAGVHFPPGTAPADLGWKALAVNLSDLAAMGAEPSWCTLSLCLPEADPAWLEAFLDGLLALAREHRVALVGGDTTRGPLSVSVTALGAVPAGQALRRDGAKDGDEVWITGRTGEAAGALRQWRDGGARDAALRLRLDRPTPRVGAGLALRGLATACIDVSDGLLADLGHVLRASGVGARLALAQLPVSPALCAAFPDADLRHALQLGGGDDYELCFTAPPARHGPVEQALARCGLEATCIGRIEPGTGLQVWDAAGRPWAGPAPGWDHFAAGAV